MPCQQGERNQCISMQSCNCTPTASCSSASPPQKAKVEGSTDGPCALFEPEPELRSELSMPEALVKPDASCIVTLLMENSSFEPTRLKNIGAIVPSEQPVRPGSTTRHYRTPRKEVESIPEWLIPIHAQQQILRTFPHQVEYSVYLNFFT